MARCIVLAANAIPLGGGQGVNLYQVAEGLHDAADLTVFAAGSGLRAPTQVVPRSRIAALLRRTRLLRRARGRITLLEDAHFDRRVAARLPAADVFHGVTGQCGRSLAAAGAQGTVTVVDSITTHIDDFTQCALAECRALGAGFPIHPRHRGMMREEYRRADRIRVMSEHARRSFVEHGIPADKIGVVHPPLTLEQFPCSATAHDGFRVGYVGAIEPWKGVHYLVDAFRGVPDDDWQLVLVGGPGSRRMSELLGQWQADDPRITARPIDVRREGFGTVYGQLDVLVHPSVSDGFGQSVAEAMACGIPVIVTASTGAGDLVTHGLNGFIVPPRAPDTIRAHLLELARDEARRREMGTHARQTVAEYTVARFQSQYDELVGSHS